MLAARAFGLGDAVSRHRVLRRWRAVAAAELAWRERVEACARFGRLRRTVGGMRQWHASGSERAVERQFALALHAASETRDEMRPLAKDGSLTFEVPAYGVVAVSYQ